MDEYLKLQKDDWNNLVSDETQCMRLSTEKEIKYLSKLDKNC